MPEYEKDELASGKENHPARDGNQDEIDQEASVLRIPQLCFALYLHDVCIGEFLGFAQSRQYIFFVPEQDGADPRNAGLDADIDLVSDGLRVGIEVGPAQGSGADEGHLSLEHVEELGKFVQLGEAEDSTKRQDPGVSLFRDGADSLAAPPHRYKFVYFELELVEADAWLIEEHVSLARELEYQGDDCQQGREKENQDRGEQDIEGAFEEQIHQSSDLR